MSAGCGLLQATVTADPTGATADPTGPPGQEAGASGGERKLEVDETHDDAWDDNPLDELGPGLRGLRREVSRREWERSRLKDRGLGRIHDLDALRCQLTLDAS